MSVNVTLIIAHCGEKSNRCSRSDDRAVEDKYPEERDAIMKVIMASFFFTQNQERTQKRKEQTAVWNCWNEKESG